MRDAIVIVLAWVAAVVSATCINPYGQQIGTVIHNQLGRDLHISIDVDSEQYDSYQDVTPFYDVLPPNSGPHCIPGLPQTSQTIFLGLTCNANNASVGSRRDADTLVEVHYGQPDTEESGDGSRLTYYDVDLEKGFSVPVWCTGPDPTDTRDAQVGCKTDILHDLCPVDLVRLDGDSMIQCLNPQTPDMIEQWRQVCPDSYVMADDNWSAHGLGSYTHGESIPSVIDDRISGTQASLTQAESRQ